MIRTQSHTCLPLTYPLSNVGRNQWFHSPGPVCKSLGDEGRVTLTFRRELDSAEMPNFKELPIATLFIGKLQLSSITHVPSILRPSKGFRLQTFTYWRNYANRMYEFADGNVKVSSAWERLPRLMEFSMKQISLALVAKNRGQGYNDIFVA